MIRKTSHGAQRMYLTALGMATALCVWAPAASAQDEPLPDNNSGTGQYVEPVPDARGDRPAAPNPQNPPERLPPEVRDRVPPGEERDILGRIAEDPGAGAPDGTRGSGTAGGTAPGASGGGGGATGDGPARTGGSGADEGEGRGSAVASAVFDSDSPAAVVVLFAVLGMTLTVIVLRRRRRS